MTAVQWPGVASEINGESIPTLIPSDNKSPRQIDALTAQLQEHEQAIATTIAKLMELQKAAQLAFGADLSTVPARKFVPKHHIGSWGQITRALLSVLVQANGIPKTTSELAALVARSLDLESDPEQTRKLQEAIRHYLKRLRNRHLIRRASASPLPGQYATWVLADSVA